ncbi:leucine-rich repeat-containing protein 71-like [Helicoverpa zea]|uniref:leucine-rich repeat-containing protein 71-like n=1 Tax=Helicoverpa zea TaxID=7113 RepID=UPI001F570C8E|nr:leucine-rich repeat-containing protein 71-like [Helicoverpa zea]
MYAAPSFRSLPSYKSFSSTKSRGTISDADFDFCLKEVFKRYNCPVGIAICKEYVIRDKKTPKSHESKLKYKRITASPLGPDAYSIQTYYGPEVGVTLELITKYDHGHLTELKICEFRQIILPKSALKLIGLIVNSYQQLNRFTIKNCRIDKFVVQEVEKILNRSTITEICLDDCPLREANYDILLKPNSCLKSLSLCRCRIDDDMCQRLAAELHLSEHAEKYLVTLNLSSNQISDTGAKYFAEALRSNRHLRYLNLADNSISDEGASHLFNTLIKFPLTEAENRARKHRHMIYMRMKHRLYLECVRGMGGLQKPSAPSVQSRARSTTVTSHKKIARAKHTRKLVQNKTHVTQVMSTASEENVDAKADLLAKELAGPFEDPFSPSNVRVEDGVPYCVGNFVLCYLNLQYNDLTYLSVTKLVSVLEYQQENLQSGEYGLIKVLLYGNPLPIRCVELKNIQEMLHARMSRFQSKLKVTSKTSRIGIYSESLLK